MYQKIPYQMNWSEFSSKSLLNDQVLKASLHQGNLKSLHQTREDGTIESAVPLPARVVRGHPPSPPGQYIDAPSPEYPRSLVKVSPHSLPRKTGLKGGVPFLPLDIIFQFVPVPLPFITNYFFPGCPETIDSFFSSFAT